MFTCGETIFTIFDIFLILIFLISIAQIIISVILNNQVKTKLKNYKFKEVKDINITGLNSIKFTQNNTMPIYNLNVPNLGFAGELIIECYTGLCTIEKEDTNYQTVCKNWGDDERCESEEVKTSYYEKFVEVECTIDCFKSRGKICNSCPSEYDSSEGFCTINSDDYKYNKKYCLSDNVIFFWKEKKYEAKGITTGYSYVKDAKLKNEECPAKTRNCGILDDNENKLCLRDDLECPINIISEEKINNSNSYFQVGNKTFYYGYDENAKNKKIIAGLYVDTDIYINQKEDYILLDTYTISGVLKENELLYREVDLGFDPYKEKNIDKKGKSYLKIRYNSKEVDLISLRDDYKKYQFNKDIENNQIRPITKHFSTFNKLGIAGYSYLTIIIFFLILLGFNAVYQKKKNFQPQQIKRKNIFLYCFIPSMIPFIVLSIIPAINSCTIIGKLNKIKDKTDISVSSLIAINIIYIILFFLLLGIILIFIVIFYIYRKRKDLSDNQEIKSENNTTINNFVNDINSNSNVKEIQPKN